MGHGTVTHGQAPGGMGALGANSLIRPPRMPQHSTCAMTYGAVVENVGGPAAARWAPQPRHTASSAPLRDGIRVGARYNPYTRRGITYSWGTRGPSHARVRKPSWCGWLPLPLGFWRALRLLLLLSGTIPARHNSCWLLPNTTIHVEKEAHPFVIERPCVEIGLFVGIVTTGLKKHERLF